MIPGRKKLWRVTPCIALLCVAVTAVTFADDPPAKSPPKTFPSLHPLEKTKPEKEPVKFRWAPALTQSFFALGFYDGFRIAAQKQSRYYIFHGHWMQNYGKSLGAFHGWDDGDGFLASYVAHPMEGSIGGYIQRQNDPLYRDVEFAMGRRYWRSTVRSFAFSSLYSVLWSMGPLGEAAVGNVQLHNAPGLVDLVGSSTMGMAWMIGEDAIDRYGVRFVERHWTNPVFLVFFRGFATPTRTFANMLGLKEPWFRPNRPGLFHDAHAARVEAARNGEELLPPGSGFGRARRADGTLIPDPSESPRESRFGPFAAPFELAAAPVFERFSGGGSCLGGGGEGALRLSVQFQLVVDVRGCKILDLLENHTGDYLTYQGGARWTPLANHRVSPFVHGLIGGMRLGSAIKDPALQKKLNDEYHQGLRPHFPDYTDYTVVKTSDGFSVTVGGGLDVVVNRALGLRVLRLDYTHSGQSTLDLPGGNTGFSFSSGLILRLGTW